MSLQRLPLVLLLLLVAIELGFRLLAYAVLGRPFWDGRKWVPDEHLIWKLNPGYQGSWETLKHIEINSLGLVGPELIRPKDPDTIRLIVVGGSVTFGNSCTDLDSTCCPMLLNLLQQRGRGERYELFNGSVAGYSSYNGRQFVEHQLPGLDADILILAFGWNDIAHDLAEDKTPGKDWQVYDTATRGALTYSYTLQALRAVHQVVRSKIGRSQLAGHESFPYRVVLENFWENLRAMIQECRRLGVTPILLCEPHPRNYPDREGRLELHGSYLNVLRDLSRELQAPLADADSAFAAYPTAEVFQRPERQFIYPTTFGHRLMAEMLYSCVLRDRDSNKSQTDRRNHPPVGPRAPVSGPKSR
jgi:lysophospholipase L1-like esterase